MLYLGVVGRHGFPRIDFQDGALGSALIGSPIAFSPGEPPVVYGALLLAADFAVKGLSPRHRENDRFTLAEKCGKSFVKNPSEGRGCGGLSGLGGAGRSYGRDFVIRNRGQNAFVVRFFFHSRSMSANSRCRAPHLKDGSSDHFCGGVRDDSHRTMIGLKREQKGPIPADRPTRA